MTDARTPQDLRVERSRRGLVLLWIAAFAVVIAFGAWFVTHPAPLPVPEQPVAVEVPLGEAVYVGVYDPAADGDRTLHISEVSIEVDGAATVVARVCRDGTISVTSQPEEFCSTVTDASFNIHSTRSRGYPGSIGRYPPPALSTANSATTISTDRSIKTPTSTSGPTPDLLR